jgi:hypothetical protein
MQRIRIERKGSAGEVLAIADIRLQRFSHLPAGTDWIQPVLMRQHTTTVCQQRAQ